MKTPIISFNVTDNGRVHTGIPRFFDPKAICEAVNSSATQERVRNRDMIGYYGHWPRLKLGARPAEGGIIDGKAQAIEPALVTVYLSAKDDGTIEHQAEFTSTQSGKLAAKLFNDKLGGFSAIMCERAREFWGFDYVLEPNFTQNRGYTFDSAAPITLDDAIRGEHDEYLRAIELLTDARHATLVTLDSVLEELERYRAENDLLISALAHQQDQKFVMPAFVSMDSANRMIEEAQEFSSAKLLIPRSHSESDKLVESAELAQQMLRGGW